MKKLFVENENYINLFEYPTEVLEMTIKEVYEEIPKIKYPLITIEEINNTEDKNFRNNDGEQVSDLTYQIEIYSRQTTKFQATETVRKIGKIINDYLNNSETYRCLTRIGTPVLLPVTGDKSIMRYVLRYDCKIELNTHTIYQNI